MKSPSKDDWISQVLKEQDEFEINLELNEIQCMSKLKFKSLVQEKVKEKAFKYLMNKKDSRDSDNAKGKLSNYSTLAMNQYLTHKETEMSIDEKKWLLKCRIEDIDILSNRNWNKEDIRCKQCPNEVFTQKHLLLCKGLQRKKRNIIPYSKL